MDADKFRTMVGWFDSGTQEKATHDPMSGRADCGVCVLCEEPIACAEVCRTFCIRMLESAFRSYFYRLHRACDDAQKEATDKGCSTSDDKVLAAIELFGMEVVPVA